MLFTGLRFNLSSGVGGADRNRPVDSGPDSDILRCVDVGVLGMPTREAAECCLARAVAGVNEPAGPALLARIRPLDHLHPNPGPSCLVLDEGSELVERPLVVSLALPLRNRGPQEDAREVFESDPPLRALCRANDLLADGVVGIGLKPAFSAGDLPQSPLGRLGSGLLETPSVSAVPLPHLLGGLAGVGCPVARGGDVDHPEIDPEVFGGFGRLGVRGLDGRVEPERPVSVDEVRLLDGRDRREVCGFAVSELDPTLQCPDAHPVLAEGEYPANRSRWPRAPGRRAR